MSFQGHLIVMQCKAIAERNDILIEEAVYLIESYIFLMKGRRIKINKLQPQKLFEQAATVATNYFLSV